MVSERERISHVVRRLSVGVHPDRIDDAADVDAAIAAALDLSAPPAEPYSLAPPADADEARQPGRIREPAAWWFEQMVASARPLEERLVWFWHDHFATAISKVRSADLMWNQHLVLREHATDSFADLLRAIATDGAMLVYLDGVQNTARNLNENYAREVMELHTLGIGSYTQHDVVEAARCFTGWVVNLPSRPRIHRDDVPDRAGYFVARRHDDGVKTLLGVTGNHDLDDAIDILLERPETARFVAGKLYAHLVGTAPDDDALGRVADVFARDYSIMALVEEIVADPAFVADDAVRARVRTPVEKLVGLIQAAGGATVVDPRAVAPALDGLGYVPFNPPNPAGYPSGAALLGPHQLVHTFDLLAALGPEPDVPDLDAADTLARFGLFDVSDATADVLAGASSPFERFALALGSPEFALT